MRTTIIVLLILTASSPSARAQQRLGGELDINSLTIGAPREPQIAASMDGSFVVVWELSDLGVISARRFNADGSPVTGEILVGGSTASRGKDPDVAVDENGGFVVVWSEGDELTPPAHTDIFAKRYSPSGTVLGAEFRVNTYTPEGQSFPAISMRPSGEFVVVWSSYGSWGNDDSSNSIQMRRYSASATPLDAKELQVNIFTAGSQTHPDVSLRADGSGAMVWQDNGPVPSYIIGMELDLGMTPSGPEVVVSTEGDFPSVAAGAGRDYLATWQRSVGGDASSDVEARLIPAGALPGPTMTLNTITFSFQYSPSVAWSPDHDFLVVWASIGSLGEDSSGESIQARIVDDAGIPGPPEVQVNALTGGDQTAPSVAAIVNNRFVVAFESEAAAKTIRAQRIEDSPLFSDGFESGDTSAWAP